MATGITSWSQTANSNANASANINFAEGQSPPSLNDSCRALMGEVKRFVDDLAAVQPSNVTQTTTGTANAQVLTTNGSAASLLNGWTVAFKAGATNTGACTINVDSLGAVAIQAIAGTALGGNEIVAGRIYRITYSQPNSAWLLHTAASVPAFDSGTLMLFQQTAAPTGWTKQVTHNDKALRVVSGAAASGGTNAFSTVMAQTTTGSHAISVAELPNTSFTISASVGTGLSANVVTSLTANTNNNSAGGGANAIVNSVSANTTAVHLSSGTVTGTAASGGSDTGHTHTMTMDIQYVDLILASKN